VRLVLTQALLGGPSTSSLDPQFLRMREVSKELWGEVFDLVTEILCSDAAGDTQRFGTAVAALHAVYVRQEELGKPDPALTEALADFTDDAAEAAALYRVAIAQCTAADEPTHTKRVCLAARLIELGDLSEARSELAQGRAEAERLNDAEYVNLAEELLSHLAI
jgi:hypothetical protein